MAFSYFANLIALHFSAGASSSPRSRNECPLYSQLNCVAGTPGLGMCGSTKTIHCLGNFSEFHECERACQAISRTKPCHSWAYYYPDTASSAFRGSCFGRFDDVWTPKAVPVGKTHVISGQNCEHPPITPSPTPKPPTPSPLPPLPVRPPAPIDPELHPVAFLGGNMFNKTSTGDLITEHLCKFQVVAPINSYCWEANSADHIFCSNRTQEISAIVGVTQLIRKKCPSVLFQMYLNSMMNFWWYSEMFDRFLGNNQSLLLHDETGNLVLVQQDGGNKNMTVFDWTQDATRDIIMEIVDTAIANGISSFFLDKGNVQARDGKICNHVCANITERASADWNIGHNKILRDIAIKSTGPTIANAGLDLVPIMGGAGGDGFRCSANLQGINKLRAALDDPYATTIFAKFPFTRNGYAAFLMTYISGRAFMWDYSPAGTRTIWIEEFDRPIGPPLENATVVDGIYLRRFKYANVTFDTKTNIGDFIYRE